MREIKFCYRELQGLMAHFRQIKNNIALKTAQQTPVVWQNLLNQPEEISFADRQAQKNTDSSQPDLDLVCRKRSRQ